MMNDYDERIHDLEKIDAEKRLINLEQCLDRTRKSLGLAEDRLEALVQDHEDLLSRYEGLAHLKNGKIRIPHRCPVCNGTVFDAEGTLCLPCDGKGIVWG